MGNINSRAKGSRNERKLAKQLEEWTGREFSRTPSSGGLHWKNSQTSGDIVCTTEGHLFPFSIEAKFHREINFEHLLYLDQPLILDFWEQCLKDANEAQLKKIPLLFMRYNGMPSDLNFVAMPWRMYDLIWGILPKGHRNLRYSGSEPNEYIVLIRSTSLFKASYKDMRTILKSTELWPQRKRKK